RSVAFDPLHDVAQRLLQRTAVVDEPRGPYRRRANGIERSGQVRRVLVEPESVVVVELVAKVARRGPAVRGRRVRPTGGRVRVLYDDHLAGEHAARRPTRQETRLREVPRALRVDRPAVDHELGVLGRARVHLVTVEVGVGEVLTVVELHFVARLHALEAL